MTREGLMTQNAEAIIAFDASAGSGLLLLLEGIFRIVGGKDSIAGRGEQLMVQVDNFRLVVNQ